MNAFIYNRWLQAGLIHLLTTFFLLPASGLSQVTQEWVAKYNGPGNSFDGATAMVVDSAGNVYVTGFSFVSKSNSFDEEFKDIVTIKYNTAGEQEWAVRYNGPGNGEDHPVDIALDSAGNIYVTGYSTGSEVDETDPNSSYDYVTIKYDEDGTELWVGRYNGPGNGWDAAWALEVDAAGNVYVTGTVYVAGYVYGNSADYDIATIKYNTDGVRQWVKRYNGPLSLRDGASALALDAAGNVYVTGSSQSDTDTFRRGAVTIKYDTNGNEVWATRYSGPEDMSSIFVSDLALDAAGNVYVTGYSWSELDSDGLRMLDYITIKYDTTGTLQWARLYDSSELVSGYVNEWRDDVANALAVDAEGNVYVTGQTGSREEDPDNAILTIKYSSLGDELWVALYDGPGGPQGGGGEDIVLDAEGNVYVTGSVTMTQEWENRDYTTIKYNSESVQQWLIRYNGLGNYIDDARAIAVDASGNVYVTGQSYVSDELDYTNADSEYATIKYSQTPCTPPTPAITVVPTSDVYTGGDPCTIYLGYGPHSVRLVASGGESYVWSPATGLSSTATAETVFTPTAAGTYTFTVTAYSGACLATASVTVKVVDARCGTQGKVRVCHNGRTLCLNPSAAKAHLRNHKSDRLGICGEALDAEEVPTVTIPLKVFPNPFGEWTNVEFSLPVGGDYRLELYSANGKMLGIVAKGQGQKGQIVKLELKGQQMLEGIYYLKLITPDQIQTLRLVLKK